MKLTVRRVSGVQLVAENARGQTIVMDGPPKLGGEDKGMRPMELLLASLAGCSMVDVVMILDKGRQPYSDLSVAVEGRRADAIPAVFEEIHLHFTARGELRQDRLERAVRLSVDKYCSVAAMIRHVTNIQWSCSVDEG